MANRPTRPVDAATTEEAAKSAPQVAWDRRLEAVLDEWRRRAWASQVAHYRVASQLRVRHRVLGLPVVIFTTAVGTSIFATLNESSFEAGLWPRIIVGTIAIAAAVLAGIQTFFGFAQRADQHVIAADWYAAIRRGIEQIQATPRETRGDAREVLTGVRKEMNQVGSQFPEIGQRVWAQTARQFGIEEPPAKVVVPEA
jgi:hypothetical protein